MYVWELSSGGHRHEVLNHSHSCRKALMSWTPLQSRYLFLSIVEIWSPPRRINMGLMQDLGPPGSWSGGSLREAWYSPAEPAVHLSCFRDSAYTCTPQSLVRMISLEHMKSPDRSSCEAPGSPSEAWKEEIAELCKHRKPNQYKRSLKILPSLMKTHKEPYQHHITQASNTWIGSNSFANTHPDPESTLQPPCGMQYKEKFKDLHHYLPGCSGD